MHGSTLGAVVVAFTDAFSLLGDRVAAPTEEHLRDVVVVEKGCGLKRGAAFPVADVGVRAVGTQEGDGSEAVVRGCVVQQRRALLVACVRRGTRLQVHLDTVRVAPPRDLFNEIAVVVRVDADPGKRLARLEALAHDELGVAFVAEPGAEERLAVAVVRDDATIKGDVEHLWLDGHGVNDTVAEVLHRAFLRHLHDSGTEEEGDTDAQSVACVWLLPEASCHGRGGVAFTLVMGGGGCSCVCIGRNVRVNRAVSNSESGGSHCVLGNVEK